ncbi:class I SAM-dependent methyltransferase [Methanosarcina vacuolata]|uniref:Putative methyltransferase n=1 Tax=Methanosarcina vacuolata Z-761 TaxID=1434123 RepID=A0A0E3Q345_9EURY|nr:class I SAM-dependent methyltransferase [Methanosarcina vacuolata]AKB42868.1 putative methyltransferase [Methanosarcina vacuolata Z-761]
MSELSRKMNQCRKPAGEAGKLVADEMNINHYELTSWGLGKIDIKQDSIILDIGCGGGRTVNRLALLAPEGKVFGIDYSNDCVNWSIEFNKGLIDSGKVEIHNASVEKIPFEDNKFDWALAVETVYFWPNLLQNLSEIKRVLKPSGRIMIINEMYASQNFKDRNDPYVKAGNLKLHTPQELEELLKKAGYVNIQIHLVENKNWMCCIGEKSS